MSRKSFSREAPERRRQDLIDATLSVIARDGYAAATVRAISEEAQVTQGLIRHYFTTKEDLLAAAYEHHMSMMTERALGEAVKEHFGAVDRLRQVIRNSCGHYVMTQGNLTLWASFLAKVHTAEQINETHARTYLQYRDALADLIRAVYVETGKPVDDEDLRAKAIQCNAVLDGLWIEGAAVPGEFDPGEVEALALRSVGQLLDLPL